MNEPAPDPRELLLTVFSRWRHVKTGGTYLVLGVARCATNGPHEGERAVVYWSNARRHLNYREVSQFLDGRFVRIPPEAEEGVG